MSEPKPPDPFGRDWRSARGLLPLAFVLVVGIQALINGASVSADLTHRHVLFEPAEPWIWELSSAVGLLVAMLPMYSLYRPVADALRNVWARIGTLVAGSVAFSLVHVLTMIFLRKVIYIAQGWHYVFGPLQDALIYEYRKDALTFCVIVVALAGLEKLRLHGAPEADRAPLRSQAEPPTFLVRTSRADLLIPANDIDWVEAQGNYVALHVGDQVRLLRHTMSEMERRLEAHGFIRTHRRAIVRRERMEAIVSPQIGESGVRLRSGGIAPLSEARRAQVLKLILEPPMQ